MADFNIDEVWILAKTVLDGAVQFNSGDFPSYFGCKHCYSQLVEYNTLTKKRSLMKDFKHDSNCPCLVAKDVLTRCEE